MSEKEGFNPLVIDFGSLNCRAGIGGEEGPRTNFPNCIEIDEDKFIIGQDDEDKRIDYKIIYPFHRGLVKNETQIEHIEKIYKYA